MRQPLFAGLVVDEEDRAVEVAYVGDEPCYVVDDAGFRRHIPSEQVDRQVLQQMFALVEGHEDVLSEQAAQLLGQTDPFSKAALEMQFKNLEQRIEDVLAAGIPEEHRAYMGMLGFRVRIDVHGDVIEIRWPGMEPPEDE